MSAKSSAHWWVNHKQTFQQEFEGGYLWSPKTSASGANNEFYNNMRRAQPGDTVVSYADGRIRAVGVVSDTATTAPKPTSFRSVGSNWSEWGWLLPVQWQPVQVEARPTDDLARLLPALPRKYSPLRTSTGKGNQGAYLSEIGADLMALVMEWTQGLRGLPQPPCDTAVILEQVEEKECEEIQSDSSLSQSERATLILARKGQGAFRDQVIRLHERCVVTGVRDLRLLRASHIKPWRLCTTSMERLDPRNGLLLAPNLDQLFDKGLISFGEDGSLIVSSTLDEQDVNALGLRQYITVKVPLAAHSSFIQYHREEIFIP